MGRSAGALMNRASAHAKRSVIIILSLNPSPGHHPVHTPVLADDFLSVPRSKIIIDSGSNTSTLVSGHEKYDNSSCQHADNKQDQRLDNARTLFRRRRISFNIP